MPRHLLDTDWLAGQIAVRTVIDITSELEVTDRTATRAVHGTSSFNVVDRNLSRWPDGAGWVRFGHVDGSTDVRGRVIISRFLAMVIAFASVAGACGGGDVGSTDSAPSASSTNLADPGSEPAPTKTPSDRMWEMVEDGGLTPSEAVLAVLSDPSPRQVDGELTTLLVQAELAIAEDSPEAAELERLIAGLVPSSEQIASLSGEPQGLMMGRASGAAQPIDLAECERAWRDARSNLFTGPQAAAAVGCLEVEASTISGVTINVLRPTPFPATVFRQNAVDAVKDSVGRFAAAGDLAPSIIVLYDPFGPPLAWAWEPRGSDTCYIVMTGGLDSASPSEFRHTMEHEVAHCSQFANLRDQVYRSGGSSDWWVEGGAEYLAFLEFGTDASWNESVLDEPILRQDYDNWEFWNHMDSGGIGGALRLWATIPTVPAADNDWFAARAGIDEDFHAFAESAMFGNLPAGRTDLPAAVNVSPADRLGEYADVRLRASQALSIGIDLDTEETPYRLQVVPGNGVTLSWQTGAGSFTRISGTAAERTVPCFDAPPVLLATATAESTVDVAAFPLDPDDFDECGEDDLASGAGTEVASGECPVRIPPGFEAAGNGVDSDGNQITTPCEGPYRLPGDLLNYENTISSATPVGVTDEDGNRTTDFDRLVEPLERLDATKANLFDDDERFWTCEEVDERQSFETNSGAFVYYAIVGQVCAICRDESGDGLVCRGRHDLAYACHPNQPGTCYGPEIVVVLPEPLRRLQPERSSVRMGGNWSGGDSPLSQEVRDEDFGDLSTALRAERQVYVDDPLAMFKEFASYVD